MKKPMIIFAMLLLLVSAFSGSAMALEEKSSVKLNLHTQLTVAQAVSLLVNGFDLNIDHMRFIKEPQASDYFNNVADDAEYEMDFIIAHLNGLPLDRDVKPSAKITKEAYADLLFHAMSTKGEYAFIEIFMMIEDEDQIESKYMNSIQKLLITKIAELDKDQKFHPKDPVKASQAKVMLHRALLFVKEQAAPVQGEIPTSNQEVEMTVEPVNEEVNKVTLSWGSQPNPGYQLTVHKVEFDGNGHATIFYQLHYPDPDMMYIQMIVEPKAEVYVASTYKPTIVLLEAAESGMADAPMTDIKPTIITE
jgi:hypothetical protein